MSIFYHNNPFSRGQVLGATWSHPIEKTDPLVTGAAQLLKKKVFTDVNPRNGAVLSNEVVTCVAVRNTTGAAVLPGVSQTVSGYTGVVDEYLPAAGCPDKEIYWLVIDGPTQTPLGTRVNLMGPAGTAKPRMIVPLDSADGAEVAETDATNPAVRVTPVTEEAAAEAPAAGTDSTATPDAVAPEAPATEAPVTP